MEQAFFQHKVRAAEERSWILVGLRVAKLVTCDAHEGLKAAMCQVLGSTWQRSRVHWIRNAQAYVPETQQRAHHKSWATSMVTAGGRFVMALQRTVAA